MCMCTHIYVRPLYVYRDIDIEAKFPDSPDVLNYHGELLVEAQEFDG